MGRWEYENIRQYVATMPSMGLVLALLSPAEKSKYHAKVME